MNPDNVFTGSHPNKMYKDVTAKILERGDDIAPRGMPTKELQPAVNWWTRPDQMVITIPKRMCNPFFTVFESLWILGGRGDSESVCFYNNNLAQFLDDGFTDFHAPYGRRVRKWGKHKRSPDFSLQRDEASPNEICCGSVGKTFDQLMDCYKLLERDPDTRQAVIVLWIPPYDNSDIKTNDRPCNDAIMFKVRGGKLNMTVMNRSNDMHWGLYSTNVMQFSMLQRVLASCLNLKVGHYWHHSDSLHIYHERDDISERILTADYDFDVYDYVEPYDMSEEWESLHEFDIELLKFFAIEESLRKDMVSIDSVVRLNSKFLNGALQLCHAYILHKRKEYELSLDRITSAFDAGLKDHAISAMEFVMRKYQKQKTGFADLALRMLNTFFQDRKIPHAQSSEIIHFIVSH